jgi:hypothetical protein
MQLPTSQNGVTGHGSSNSSLILCILWFCFSLLDVTALAAPLQDGEVVLGVLGCPNLPQGAVADDDGGAGGLIVPHLLG